MTDDDIKPESPEVEADLLRRLIEAGALEPGDPGPTVGAHTMSDIPKAIAESEMDFLGFKVKVHVLNDGRRVIDKSDFERVIALALEGDEAGEGR